MKGECFVGSGGWFAGAANVLPEASESLPEVQAVCDYIMMIEHGQKVFEGTINAFNTYMSPSALMTIMHNAPTTEELLKIEGIVRVERLTKTRIRLHFKGDNAIVGRVVKQAVENQWHLREISLEKEI